MNIEVDFQLWLILAAMSLLVGVSKAGFSGLGLIPVSIFAHYFGLKSVGVLLPLLVIADLTVYPAMRRHGTWKEVLPLLFPAFIGISAGVYGLRVIPERYTSSLIGSIILIMLLIILFKRYFPRQYEMVNHSEVTGYLAGGVGGFATILANAAGPILKIYLLSRGFSKFDLVGISARFFLLINLLKIPILGGIDFISKETLVLNAQLAIFVVLGVFLGKSLLHLVPQQLFDRLIVLFAFAAALNLLIQR